MSMSPEQRAQLDNLGDLLRQAFPERFPPPKKAWGEVTSVAALVLSVCSLAWTGGVIYGQQQENTRRITALEAVDQGREPLLREILVKIGRIEGDVQALKERGR